MTQGATRRLCFISRNYYNLHSAGNKAKTDTEDTLAAMGAVNIGLRRTLYRQKGIAFFLNLAGIVRAALTLQRGDVLFLQYPVKKYFTFLCKVAHRKGAKTVALIHDLGSFRRNKLTVEEEIRRLSHADYVIASNARMATWLEGHGLTCPLGELGLWDYRSTAPVRAVETTREDEMRSVVYAGTLRLRKNAFLLQLSETLTDCRLKVVGNKDGLEGLHDGPFVTWHDFMASDTFIRTIEGDFGLVWDGDSTDTCSGSFGEYLRWNTPHKVSFYLRAGLPVIVWKQSAVAALVEKEGIGLSISSLSELSACINRISTEDFQAMRERVAQMANKINDGYFIRGTVETALKRL